jgi:hypothetical protein
MFYVGVEGAWCDALLSERAAEMGKCDPHVNLLYLNTR